MMIRKIIAYAVSAVLLIVLLGCSQFLGDFVLTKRNEQERVDIYAKYEGEIERGTSKKKIELRVLENDTAIRQGYFKKLLEAFNEKYADHYIVAVDANMGEHVDLEKDGPFGFGPDILYQANDMLMKYVDNKHIIPMPIDTLDCYDKVPKQAWDAYKTVVNDEEYYCGVPVNVQSALLYYRKDMLPSDWKQNWDKNGNDIPDMTESWTDLFKYSQQIRAKDPQKYGYMKSLFDVYFASGYLFSYGGYIFGDNNTNPRDIGFSKGQSAIGADVLRQLATIMNLECVDDTITRNAYSRLASGAYFATMTTPDVYTMFIKELRIMYKDTVRKPDGSRLTDAEAEAMAIENLVMSPVPQLPKSGNLSEENPELMDCKMMGGVNGYAISAYTKYPKAALAFIDFATSYEMAMQRNAILGISPARIDAATELGGLHKQMYDNLVADNIVVMPSIKEVAQIWTPAENLFADLALDAFRKPGTQVYTNMDKIKAGLKKVDQDIYKAIFTLGD